MGDDYKSERGMMPKITDNVYAGTNFRGCNSSFVVTGEGVVVIDTPMVPAEAIKWREEAQQHGEIKYVINGEPHPDHIAGDYWFPGHLVAHEGTRQAITKVRKEELQGQLQMMAPDAMPLDKEYHIRLPDITFSQKLTLYLGDHTFQLMHLPGHTPYQIAAYVPEEKVVFTSDNVIQAMPIMFQCVPYDWLESLKRLQQLDVEKVVPGHGEVSDKAYLQVMYDNLKYCIDTVKAAIDKGWSLKETQEKVTFAERFPPMGPGDPMVRMRHESIAHLFEVLQKENWDPGLPRYPSIR
jgi:cyclase